MKIKHEFIINRLNDAKSLLNRFLDDDKNLILVEKAINTISASLMNNNRVISCGNGGSMCDAMHFAQELTGRFNRERKPLPAIAVSDPSHMSCTANDYGYDKVFSRMIEALGNKGDILLAISTSGNSPNVYESVKTAKELGMDTVGLLGKDGGKVKDYCDIPIIVPSNNTARIQEIHIKIIHIFIEAIENEIFFSYE
jgi:D-sedoheptulose 7-phosphate isomerase